VHLTCSDVGPLKMRERTNVLISSAPFPAARRDATTLPRIPTFFLTEEMVAMKLLKKDFRRCTRILS